MLATFLDAFWNDITLREYPVATVIHWLQGIVAGNFAVRAHYRRHWHLTGYAALLAVCFIAYETLEQLRIQDRGDVDILNFVMMFHGSGFVTFVYYATKRFWKR